MPCFICAKCFCVDNTATGYFWGSSRTNTFKAGALPPELLGKPLCCECAPAEYSDGSINKDYGIWHGLFPKEHFEVVVDRANPDELKYILNLKDFITQN